MKKSLFAAAIAALLSATPALAEDVLKYSTSVAGIPLGKIKVIASADGQDYTARAHFSMIPVLRQIFHGDASATAEGSRAGDDFVPRQAVFLYAGRDEDRRRRIRFEGGVPVELDAWPPIRETSYRMSLDEAAGAIDPATAAVVRMTPRERPCDLSLDIFDGTKRHRITLSGQARPAQGSEVTCTGLYERVNGFKAKYMTPERRSYPFTASFAGRNGRWIPLKITADTKFGPASATLRR